MLMTGIIIHLLACAMSFRIVLWNFSDFFWQVYHLDLRRKKCNGSNFQVQHVQTLVSRETASGAIDGRYTGRPDLDKAFNSLCSCLHFNKQAFSLQGDALPPLTLRLLEVVWKMNNPVLSF